MTARVGSPVRRPKRRGILGAAVQDLDTEKLEEAVELGLESLFPQRPGQDEDSSTDWEFELEWEVELIPPDKARKVGKKQTDLRKADTQAPADSDESVRSASDPTGDPHAWAPRAANKEDHS